MSSPKIIPNFILFSPYFYAKIKERVRMYAELAERRAKVRAEMEQKNSRILH